MSRQERGGQRAWLGRLRVEGPLDVVTLDADESGWTWVNGPFLAGELVELDVLVPVRDRLAAPGAPPSHPGPRVKPKGGAGRAEWLGWQDPQPVLFGGLSTGSDPALETELLARSLPPLPGPETSPAPGMLGLLLAACVLGYAMRRRALLTLALGLVAALALFFAHGVLLGGGARPVVIHEGVFREGQVGLAEWWRMERAREDLELPGVGGRLRLEVAPLGSRVILLLGRNRESGRMEGRAVARDALLAVFTPTADVGLSPSRNGWADLEAVWVRLENGLWEARGPWPRGFPLPAEALPGGGGPPPAWLIGGLPGRPGSLVGRRDGRSWFRLTAAGD